MIDARAAVAASAILLFTSIGLTLPDVDQPLPLDHRSALTHSILPAAAALVRRWARPIAAGLGFGIGLHLAADVFPNAMIGYATVKLPIVGSIGPGFSYGWLAANAIACTALGAWLLRREIAHLTVRWLLLAAVGLTGLIYLLTTDGGWAALAVCACVAWASYRFSRIARGA